MSDDKNNLKDLYRFNSKFKHVGEDSFWFEFYRLLEKYKAVNIGTGFPDYNCFPYINKALEDISKETDYRVYQYARIEGQPRLVNCVAKYYSKLLDRSIDPFTEVFITPGADGGLSYLLNGILDDNDEIIIIEPFFLNYKFMLKILNVKTVYVPLIPSDKLDKNGFYSSNDWRWNEDELRNAFSAKTRAIIINSPNNPLGKVFNRDELNLIAELCIKHNVICISDEVYDNYTFDKPHIRIATFPGMWERTFTIGSAGKTFAITGAKTGWIVANKDLLKLPKVVHVNSLVCLTSLVQEIVAKCFEFELERLDTPESFFNNISKEIKPKRDYLAKLLLDAGLIPVIPDGGFFMLVNIANKAKDIQSDLRESKDAKFVKYLVEKGIGAFPSNPFFRDKSSVAENYIRICMFKKDSTLDEAALKIKNFSLKD